MAQTSRAPEPGCPDARLQSRAAGGCRVQRRARSATMRSPRSVGPFRPARRARRKGTGGGRGWQPPRTNRPTFLGACAVAWIPVLTTGKPRASGAITAKYLAVTSRPDGTRQVTYDGKPLYLYSGEKISASPSLTRCPTRRRPALSATATGWRAPTAASSRSSTPGSPSQDQAWPKGPTGAPIF